jgi:uncharacterized damage-inducible protein DinB
MKFNDLLADAFGRIQERVHEVLEGLDPDQLSERPGGNGNSIAWLIWHLTRVQDDHIADVAGVEQRWTSGGWAELFDLPLDTHETGYGHTSDQVSAVAVESGSLLAEYFDAVHRQSLEFIGSLTEDELDRIVDTRWDPHVTLGVRLVSVIDDCLEHAGQAAYVKGLVQHREARG